MATKLKITYGDEGKTVDYRQTVEIIERVIACYAHGIRIAPNVSEISGDDVNLCRFILDIVQRMDEPPKPCEMKGKTHCKECKSTVKTLPCVLCGIASTETKAPKIALQNPLVKKWRKEMKSIKNDKYLTEDYREGQLDALEQAIEEFLEVLGQ